MIYFILIFWFLIFTKKLFFWIYLWQLKEYHLGRFIDYFRTEKGKRIIINQLVLVKLLVFIGLVGFFVKPGLVQNLLIYFIFTIFFVEAVFTVKKFFQKTIKIPILTKKTNLILSVGISLELLVLPLLFGFYFPLFQFVKFLLALDILAPIFCSVLVLAFQPLAVAFRNQIIKQAKEKRERFKDLLVIGITGSYGKTSVKEFLATVLAEKYNVLKTKEHQNSEVGISQCILNDLKEEHEIFVCEMGAYNKGGIRLLSDIAKPKIGILTGINEQHMATFGSQRNITETKYELIESLPQDGLAILNYNNPIIKKTEIEYCNPKLKNVKFYSIIEGEESKLSSSPFATAREKEADFWASNIRTEKESISFKLFSKDGDQATFNLNLLGLHNIHNILAAACCAKSLGMTLEEIAKACAKIEKWQSGMQLKSGLYGFNIIDATYSANPTGVMAHLDYLKVWSGKKVIIMPCLIELGSSSKDVHKRIGEKIGEVCDLAMITTKERFEEIKEGAGEKALFMENPKEIFEKVRSFCQEGDVILLESRVPGQLIRRLAS